MNVKGTCLLPRWRPGRSALTAALAAAAILAAPGGAAAPAKAPVKVAPSAKAQMDVLRAIKLAKTATQAKIDSRLYLGALNLAKDARLAALPDFRFVKPEADGRVAVDIVLTSSAGQKAVTEKLLQLGGAVRAKSLNRRQILGRAPLAALVDLAAMPEVRKVRQQIPRRTGALTTSEGDRTHDVFGARGYFGVTGAGVKVGVISDGVDSLAALQASGDLPAVQVLPGQAGTGDEGSAMLEIVHDLAPGAALAFATADPDQATFAANILALAAAGCTIIVDDILYLAESPFQDSAVAQAVNTVTAAGVLYFSSAGNQGNKAAGASATWEGNFAPSAAADPGPLAGANLHDFGDGGNSILVADSFFGPPLLIWAEHYDDVTLTGTASTDFDLYDMNGTLTTIFDASTDVQDGSGGDDWPIEFISGGVFSGERLLIDKFADGTTTSVPMMNLVVFDSVLDNSVATTGATRGHSAAAAAFSTAATPAAASWDGVTADGPYPNLFTSANEAESFTADGPRRIILDPAGAELTPGNRTATGGVVRQKPDITAADGVSCSAPGFATFYGTSAAAPHAAAIAALLKSALPALTPAQVRTALVGSAIDIGAAGADVTTGAGIVMARAALQAAGASPVAHLSAGTAVPVQVIGDGDAYVETNEVWSATVPLTNDGGVGASAISAVLTTSTAGVTINTGTSAYPDLAVSATGSNTTPFVFTVGPSVPCGGTISFTLTVTYGGGTGPQAFPFSIRVGAPGAPVTFSYAGPAVPIPDAADLSGTLPGAVAIASLPVSGVVGGIYDVNLRIDGTSCSATAGSTTVGIDHTFVNDLQLTLRGPSSTGVLAVSNTDSSGNNFCQTVLDDESAGASIQSVTSANAPFTNTYTPNSPLAAFRGQTANGTWQLEAQDFFSGDTGNIRAFSVIITPAVCDAPPLVGNVTGTMTAAGTFRVGSTVTYTVTLTNSGGLAQPDNPGNEFTDVLPAGLTLVSASATTGTAVATIGTNTVTWNGALAAITGTVTITITATVNAAPAGTSISNQGTISYDVNGTGTNTGTRVTDDPAVGGGSDPTVFAVSGATVTATKTFSGTRAVGSVATYTIVLTNSGNLATTDNPGSELTDVLSYGLTLVSASATSGTAVATIATNTVTWNGGIPAGGSVTLTITATIVPFTEGQVIVNQASLSYDSDGNGTNDATGLSDDPGVGGAADPTNFLVAGERPPNIPALSHVGLALLALGLAAIGARKVAKG